METLIDQPEQTENPIQHQKAHLQKVNVQLKKEFCGLDAVIDQLNGYISSWYCLPELQEKPLVINLWGMTGTGKTAVVKRLVDLLGCRDAQYRFDMGEITEAPGNMNVFNQLKNTEYREKEERIVWQILDNGRFEVDDIHYRDIIGPYHPGMDRKRPEKG